VEDEQEGAAVAAAAPKPKAIAAPRAVPKAAPPKAAPKKKGVVDSRAKKRPSRGGSQLSEI